ncbi:MAG TPA: redox-sensing transcriptional repressor Rex [Phycisphaerae bacterium]|nr:redox-sensing transcriptional repressor Rex [Phycisphaerae bacterium]
MLAEGIVKRLSIYRQLLAGVEPRVGMNVFSHELAAMIGVTAAQVRRDLMTIGYTGNPRRGYDVAGLVEMIGRHLDTPGGQAVVLAGLGNLGQAILAYFNGRRQGLSIVAAFDRDPVKVNRVIHGCRCYPMEKLQEVSKGSGAEVGIVAVPADAAQQVASQLVRAGVRGMLNLSPTRLQVPEYIYVEDLDIAVSLEKIAFFSRQHASEKEYVQ